MTDMEAFGLDEAWLCPARDFFRRHSHPGANNCSCPKFDGGVSCVPPAMRDAWFAYIGLQAGASE